DGSPPDCSSIDGFVGVGQPGGDCARCPLSEFGSGKDDRQACKQQRQLFIIRSGDILPILLNVPAASLKSIPQYPIRLASARTPYYGVATRLSLHKEKSKKGQEYAQIDASIAAHLLPEDAARFRALGEQLRPMLFREMSDADDTGSGVGG